MDELIAAIVKKTGISESQARGAAETCVGFLKDRLPDAVTPYVDQALGLAGRAAENVQLDSIAGALGGLFGKK